MRCHDSAAGYRRPLTPRAGQNTEAEGNQGGAAVIVFLKPQSHACLRGHPPPVLCLEAGGEEGRPRRGRRGGWGGEGCEGRNANAGFSGPVVFAGMDPAAGRGKSQMG